ncbi:uracil-DNA glycosylase [Bacillus sp. 31A1R]|uniref:Uracil-DNA glycosylase n=1 Tax=Robertmurraya mangrovi TaxID=3098077 RepID=A0ABU5IXA6_9BACI|nr:uracil-DNA glycosylase [Bacillus sp. 31A1R]MDZ5471751.1 uracil-DNA glycosylase [Bacillus sp. 31A1R]
MIEELLNRGWYEQVGKELNKPYFQNLEKFLKMEYEKEMIFPPINELFNAFHYTPYEKVKVVILGQDPYHGENQAHGLSFSVNKGVPIPPSLRNIYKELHSDLGCLIPTHGYLKKWADQGVLLLNTVLTVRSGQAHSHKNQGWEAFTDEVMRRLNDREQPVIFILWGRPAESKRKLINEQKHKVITSAHPSPLSASRGFFGSRPFSKVNDYLQQLNMETIDWQID